VVCDDDQDRAVEWQRAVESVPDISSEFEVRALSPKELVDAVDRLEHRRADARIGRNTPDTARSAASRETDGDTHPFDQAAILLIDYDLLFTALGDSEERTPSDTGERVAYLARCYSTSSVIVAVNQFSSTRSFDLTLRGHIDSFADLNISSDVLDSRSLWAGSGAEFHPWSWPCLISEHHRRDRLVRSMREAGAEQPILKTLGLHEGPTFEAMTRAHLAFLSPSGDPREATFATFVTGTRYGLRGKDVPWTEDAVIRIAAARVSKWLERVVLPGQNILVDSAHLGPRFPSLVTLVDRTPLAWNALANPCAAAANIPLDNGSLASHEFIATDWLSRRAWKWPDIARDERIRDVHDPWSIESIPFVFCEDTSNFRPREDAIEFVAEELLSEFQVRFVTRLADVRYEPEYYFAL